MREPREQSTTVIAAVPPTVEFRGTALMPAIAGHAKVDGKAVCPPMHRSFAKRQEILLDPLS